MPVVSFGLRLLADINQQTLVYLDNVSSKLGGKRVKPCLSLPSGSNEKADRLLECHGSLQHEGVQLSFVKARNDGPVMGLLNRLITKSYTGKHYTAITASAFVPELDSGFIL